MIKKLLFTLAVLLGLVVTAQTQVTVPNTLVAGTTITAAGLNTNFTTIANHALDRLAGGTLSGNIAVDVGVTIDGVDVGVQACITCTPTHAKLTLTDTSATSLTVGGGLTIGTGAVALVNTLGKIPALTASYFSSLSLAVSNLTGNFVATVAGGTGITSSVTTGNAAATAISLANTTVTPGTYGSTTLVPVLTVDQQGRLTTVTTTAVTVGYVPTASTATGTVSITISGLDLATDQSYDFDIETTDAASGTNSLTAQINGSAGAADGWEGTYNRASSPSPTGTGGTGAGVWEISATQVSAKWSGRLSLRLVGSGPHPYATWHMAGLDSTAGAQNVFSVTGSGMRQATTNVTSVKFALSGSTCDWRVVTRKMKS